MTTKGYSLFSKDKSFSNVNCAVDNRQQYSNLNLNDTYKISQNFSVQNFVKPSIDKQFDVIGSKASKNNEENIKLGYWGKSSTIGIYLKSSSLNIGNYNNKEIKKHEKIDKNLANTNSTLSLHITAYENSAAAASADSSADKKGISMKEKSQDLLQKWKSGKPNLTTSAATISYEFPRQQKEIQFSDPEVMQFKASQQLLNPNQSNASNHDKCEDSNVIQEEHQQPSTVLSEQQQQQPQINTPEDDLFDAAIEPLENDDDEKSSTSSSSSDDEDTTSMEPKKVPPPFIFYTPATNSGSTLGGKKFCCYVGNMTWWTTDSDLQSMIQACDIDDIIDIRFYENRQNGQSKGFALVVLGSDASVKVLMEKLPSKPINGQSVQVLGYSKANLDKLDGMSRKNDTRAKQTTSQSDVTAIRIDGTGAPLQQPPSATQHQQQQPPNVGGGIVTAASCGILGMIRAASNIQSIRTPTIIQPQQPNFMRPSPAIPFQTTNLMNRGFVMNQPPTHYQMHHFNAPPPQMDMEQPLSAHEFEEIMSRNHVVSSSAISRAVSDAATGDYRSAIETLLTAISLIKQSRVAKHDRCKALIASLEDTVRGIEAKHYSRKHRRSRSRSPDRSSSRKHRRRSRSRSRERYDYSPRRSRY